MRSPGIAARTRCYHQSAPPTHAPMNDPLPTPPPEADPAEKAPLPQATLGQVAGAVFWSFFGVRKGDAMRRDLVTIKPHQVIIVGILIAACLVVALLILVRLITRNA
jgi:hypothetical protein